MWRRRPFQALFPLLLAALLAGSGCTPQTGRNPTTAAVTSGMPASGTVPVQRVAALRRDLSEAEDRVRELKEQLAERDRHIAEVRSEIEAAQGQPKTESPGPTAAQAGASAPQPEPQAAPPAAAEGQPSAEPAARERAATAATTAPAAVSAVAPSNAAAPGDNGTDQRLADAQKRIAKLQQQLAMEVKRRREVETEMNRLLQETSAGPFERADNVVEKHLREQLDRANKEITELRSTLMSERRERAALERRYTTLQAQVKAAGNAPARGAASNEELEALKARQRRVLASIEQDLYASKQRETELRQSLEQSQGADATALSDTVTNLRSENSALQIRLDDEHRRNRDLSAKLQLATRVTDLIFKMQTAGTQSVAAVPLPAPQ
jgi:hypothetical protein